MACIIATLTWTVARDEYGSAVRYCCSSVPPSVYVRITLQQSVWTYTDCPPRASVHILYDLKQHHYPVNGKLPSTQLYSSSGTQSTAYIVRYVVSVAHSTIIMHLWFIVQESSILTCCNGSICCTSAVHCMLQYVFVWPAWAVSTHNQPLVLAWQCKAFVHTACMFPTGPVLLTVRLSYFSLSCRKVSHPSCL